MTARQIIVPGAMPSRDANGRSLPAKLRFYQPDTTTPATVYTSAALTTAHPFPINSDSGGRFPPIWAEEMLTFDVAWSRFDSDALVAGYAGVRPLSDALLASATASQSSADAAAASAILASDFADDASTDAAAAQDAIDVVDGLVDDAIAAKDATETARDEAVAIAGFNPALYQTRTEKGAAGGYAALDGAGLLPDAYLTGAPISTDQQAALDAAARRNVGLSLIF
jgi:hypothetical protein